MKTSQRLAQLTINCGHSEIIRPAPALPNTRRRSDRRRSLNAGLSALHQVQSQITMRRGHQGEHSLQTDQNAADDATPLLRAARVYRVDLIGVKQAKIIVREVVKQRRQLDHLNGEKRSSFFVIRGRTRLAVSHEIPNATKPVNSP